MDIYCFNISLNNHQKSVTVKSDCYESALDVLFKAYPFDNYEFTGVKNF